MAKKKGRHPKRGGRTTPKGTRPPGSDGPMPPVADRPAPPELELLDSARDAMLAGPVDALELASSIVEACTERPLDRFPGMAEADDRLDVGELLATFAESGYVPLQALAVAMLPMIDDELLVRRLRRELDPRSMRDAPSWLATLAEPVIEDTVLTTHLLGDGENVMIGASWPDGSEATAVVYVDHNMGTLVKDAFIIPESCAAVRSMFSAASDDPHTTMDTLSPADARARLVEAVGRAEITMPPLETDTWPGCRPLVEWLMSLLPEGGDGYVRPDWSDADRTALRERFAASPFSGQLDVPAHLVGELADPLIWFACDYGPGDPLRWTPVSVEIVLSDWYARKVGFPTAELQHVPDVLGAFVAFAHAERQVPSELTGETLDAVTQWTPDFMQAIEGPRPSPFDNAARLARIAAGLEPGDDSLVDIDDIDDVDIEWVDEGEWRDDVPGLGMESHIETYERWLLDEIGGPEARASLDDVPLPDEPFDWNGIPDADRSLVADVLARADAVCDAELDVEMRTLCRRYLAELVRADPSLFRRSQRTDIIAGGLVWAAIRMQGFAGSYLRPPGLPVPTQKDIAAVTGVNSGSISQRASSIESTLNRETAVAEERWWHSARRRDYLEQLTAIEQLRSDQQP